MTRSSDDRLHALITTADKIASVLFVSTGSFRATWHSVTDTGEHRIVPSPMADKEMSVRLMRAYFRVHRVVRYVFIDEAWSVMVPPDTSKAEISNLMRQGLSEHPDRVEMLMYQAEDQRGELTGHRVITRPSGTWPRLGPLEVWRPQSSEGRMVGLLPPLGSTQ